MSALRSAAAANGMSMHTPNGVLPAFETEARAFGNLEGPIGRALRLARTLKFLADLHSEGGPDDFMSETVDAVMLMARETFAAVDDIDTMWLHFHNAMADLSWKNFDASLKSRQSITDAIKAHREAADANSRAHEAHEASRDGMSKEAVAAIILASNTCFDAERAAWFAVLDAPCQTGADVQTKLAYVKERDWFDGDDERDRLLKSLSLPTA